MGATTDRFLDDSDGAARPEQLTHNHQGLDRPGQMLQDKADKEIVEGLGGKRQREDVPWWNCTLMAPACSTFRLAWATEAAEMSTDVNRASGLRRARVTVWAPMPHPASSTTHPAGYAVSECSESTSVLA